MQQILVEKNPSPMKLEVLGVEDWPIIQHAPGQCRHTAAQTETSFILTGEATLSTDGAQPVAIAPGDLVTVLPGTNCIWHVTEALTRHCRTE